MTDDKINESLRNGIEEFQKECVEIFKRNLENKFSQMTNEMYQNIENKIRDNISKTIGTSDLFDYSKVEEITNFDFVYNGADLKTLLSRYSYEDGGSEIGGFRHKMRNDFYNAVRNGEKIVIYYKTMYQNGSGQDIILITNFARMIQLNQQDQCRRVYDYVALDFHIPIDYIMIIKTILENKEPESPHTYNYIRYKTLVNVLEMIKNHLYDRKIIPLYVQDVMKENATLKSQHEQFLLDKIDFEGRKADFDLNKKHFEEYILPYTDLEREREMIIRSKKELDEYRFKLRILAKKIKIEKNKIDDEWKKLDSVDLKDLDEM